VRRAHVRAYDPVASQEELRIFAGETTAIEVVGTPRKVWQGAEVLAIVSEWKDFRAPMGVWIKRLVWQVWCADEV
jgi:UDPglucose 6-dehydrogenase